MQLAKPDPVCVDPICVHAVCVQWCLIPFTLSVLLAILGGAEAASFDCKQARTATERTICADPMLSSLDEELGTAYRATLEETKDKDRLRREQQAWLKERDVRCKADGSCLDTQIRERIRALADVLAAPAKPGEAAPRACYRIVSGARFAMCRSFTKNLNRICAGKPLACESRIHPEFAKDFWYPKWEPLDPAKNLEIIAEIVRSHVRRPDDPGCKGECEAEWREQQWREHEPELLKRLAAGRVKLWRTRIDLNVPIHSYLAPERKDELVYRLQATECGVDDRTPAYVLQHNPVLMVPDETTGKFDPDFALHLRQGGYNVIYYQGRVHMLGGYGGSGNGRVVIIADVTSGPGIGPFAVIHSGVCRIEYIEQ